MATRTATRTSSKTTVRASAKAGGRRPSPTSAKRSGSRTSVRGSRSTGRTGGRAGTKAAAKRSTGGPNTQRRMREGFVSHTELASSDPEATKAWCQQVLGWKFGDSMPTPNGPYHMWSFGENMGGGIRRNNPPEMPGTVPYCEVGDLRGAYEKALRAGAHAMMPPTDVPGSGGAIAIVQAPGGPAIGFWGKL